jgi:hypothetical protein
MHIVFQHEDKVALSKSFDLDESLRKEIIEIRDDFSVGPIASLFTPEGMEVRKNWWMEVMSAEDYSKQEELLNDDNLKVNEIKEKLAKEEDESLWIWIAPNKRDVCGYYWLISQLSDFVGRIWVLSLNNLPFINEKGAIFYPENLFEIPPKEFVKAKKLAREVSASEFELDPEEWNKMGKEDKYIRVLEGAKKLSSKEVNFYDSAILTWINNDWQKVHKIIQQFLSKSKYIGNEHFIQWRINQLIESGVIESQGDPRNRKEFEIRKITHEA